MNKLLASVLVTLGLAKVKEKKKQEPEMLTSYGATVERKETRSSKKLGEEAWHIYHSSCDIKKSSDNEYCVDHDSWLRKEKTRGTMPKTWKESRRSENENEVIGQMKCCSICHRLGGDPCANCRRKNQYATPSELNTKPKKAPKRTHYDNRTYPEGYRISDV